MAKGFSQTRRMRKRLVSSFLLISALTMAGPATVPSQSEKGPAAPAAVEGPAKPAMDAFQSGRHDKAIELAKPLAENGDPEALYLLGFAYESGKGVAASKEKAMEYYRKAIAAKHRDAAYRFSFLLLASEKEAEREEAREILETAIKEDPTVAARILGEAYLRGRLTPTPDPDKAVFWWKKAADAGDVTTMLLLARFYEGQFGFPELKDAKAAIAYYTKAADAGNTGAMPALGSRLLSGDAKIRDEKNGRKWLKKAVEAKEYSAYLVLGDFEENVNKNLKAALAEYERGKDVGQVDCTLRAADFYLEGKGVEKDVTRGNSLLTKAAEGGSTAANFRLAAQELSGEKPELLAGYGHLLAAANGNLAEAQNELALLYLSGKLAAVDSSAGVAWLTRAAQSGFAPAQNNLGTLYERGAAGLTQNLDNAGQLYTLAANQGNGPATLALARLVSEGIGTKANLVKAWALATLAQERGEKLAEKLANEINEKLDETQRNQAHKELEEMKSDGKDSKKADTKAKGSGKESKSKTTGFTPPVSAKGK